MTHIICRQYLSVETIGTEADGLALQRRLPNLCRDWLAPALERALDQWAPPDVFLSLDRLDIDAGVLAPDRLEHDLADAIVRALAQAAGAYTGADRTPQAVVSGETTRKTAGQSATEAFLYFLRTGRLSWSFRLPAGVTLEAVIRSAWRMPAGESSLPHTPDTTQMMSYTSTALRDVLGTPAARARLLAQFSAAFVDDLSLRLFPESHQIVQTIRQTLRASTVPEAEITTLLRCLWNTVIAHAAAGTTLSAQKLVGETLRERPDAIPPQSALAIVLTRHYGVAQVLGTNRDDNESATPDPAPHKRTVPDSRLHGSSNTDEEEREGIYVDCAGIVLLHPFLPQFFSALGIARDDELLQPERALCLLHYLATGQTTAPEYELMLAKILCDIPLETPVETFLELNSAEREEAAALLNAVCTHWEALGGASADGLRGTFLVRPGMITQKNDEWLLQVETMSFDILLEHLPWGISMIRLPWMRRMLHVQWG